jgi:hypothetical protein
MERAWSNKTLEMQQDATYTKGDNAPTHARMIIQISASRCAIELLQRLHEYCMYVACMLHMCYMCHACIVHGCFMIVPSMLHLHCAHMHLAQCCVRVACIMHLCCIYAAYILQGFVLTAEGTVWSHVWGMWLLHVFCMYFACWWICILSVCPYDGCYLRATKSEWILWNPGVRLQFAWSRLGASCGILECAEHTCLLLSNAACGDTWKPGAR